MALGSGTSRGLYFGIKTTFISPLSEYDIFPPSVTRRFSTPFCLISSLGCYFHITSWEPGFQCCAAGSKKGEFAFFLFRARHYRFVRASFSPRSRAPVFLRAHERESKKKARATTSVKHKAQTPSPLRISAAVPLQS